MQSVIIKVLLIGVKRRCFDKIQSAKPKVKTLVFILNSSFLFCALELQLNCGRFLTAKCKTESKNFSFYFKLCVKIFV